MQTILPNQDAQQLNDQPTVSQPEYIHNFSNLDWHTEDEPPSTQPNKLYHLLTIMGQTLIGTYPQDHTLGDHYLAWAELTSEPVLTIH